MSNSSSPPPSGPDITELRRSSRDPDALAPRLRAWLGGVLPASADPEIRSITATEANGMSSETLLFDATWRDGSARRTDRLVARVAPAAVDVPVFPTYDLDKQYAVIKRVGELTDVPVPSVRWYEGDESHLGAPFFVMDRLDGDVPSDVPPYTFGGWLADADPAQRRRLQDAVVDVLVGLHAIDRPADRFVFLQYADAGATALDRHVANRRAWYEWAVAAGPSGRERGSGVRSPLLDRGFAWLDDHLPADDSTVLSWGDSRIGNIMFSDFLPVGVFDWEMAGLAPREIDLAWLLYSHQIFQHMTVSFGMPGIPDFLRPDEVATAYEARSGHTPHHLDVFTLYAALQFGIVGLRTGARSVYFEERDMPDDIDELMFNREQIELLLAGHSLI